MAAAADGDTSDAGTGTSKLRNVLDHKRTKKHKSLFPNIEKEKNGEMRRLLAKAARRNAPPLGIKQGEVSRVHRVVPGRNAGMAYFGLTEA